MILKHAEGLIFEKKEFFEREKEERRKRRHKSRVSRSEEEEEEGADVLGFREGFEGADEEATRESV